MSDFIREVDEEYRRDRVVNFLSKYQVLLIGLVLAVIIGTAAYRVYLHFQTQAAEAANTRYDAAMQLARVGKNAEAQAAFDKLQADAPPGYAMLARLKAVEVLATRDPAAAARGFDAIAQDNALDASLRDTALMRSAYIRVDTDDPKAFETRYAPYAVSGFAFRASLRELLALAAFKRNDFEAAGRWLDEIVIDQQAPSALRSRAEAFLSLVAAGPLDGGSRASAKPAVVDKPTTATPNTPPSATTPSVTTPAATPSDATPSAAAPAGAAPSSMAEPLNLHPPIPAGTDAAAPTQTPPQATPPEVVPPPAATAPSATLPQAASPSAASPSAASPSAASPPAASPPAASPPAASPPAASPPAASPSAASPQAASPQAASPQAASPPAAPSPAASPQATSPPAATPPSPATPPSLAPSPPSPQASPSPAGAPPAK